MKLKEFKFYFQVELLPCHDRVYPTYTVTAFDYRTALGQAVASLHYNYPNCCYSLLESKGV